METMKVYEMTERLKRHYRKISPATFDNWNKAVGPIADLDVDDIDDDTALKYLEDALDRWSESTVKTRLNSLKALWRKARKKKLYKGENPWEDIDDGLEIQRSYPEYYPWEYYEYYHNDPYFVCLWYSGMRISELAGIYKENIHVDAAIPYFDLVPQSNRALKNKPSKRKVPIHPACLPHIELLYLSKAKRPGQSWSENFTKNMGLPKGQGSRTLRHSLVTRFNDLNINTRIQGAILGHTARSHTENYGEVKMETKYETILKL